MIGVCGDAWRAIAQLGPLGLLLRYCAISGSWWRKFCNDMCVLGQCKPRIDPANGTTGQLLPKYIESGFVWWAELGMESVKAPVSGHLIVIFNSTP